MKNGLTKEEKENIIIIVNITLRFLERVKCMYRDPRRMRQKEKIRRLEEECKETVKTLDQWFDEIVREAEKGHGILTMPYFFPQEIEAVKKIRNDLQEVSERLYVTESAMVQQIQYIVEDNSVWKRNMIQLKYYSPKKELLQKSRNDIVPL